MANQILVEKEAYEKDGKTYFGYCVRGMVRGKEVKVAVVPPDFGGYRVLDIIYGDSDKAELVTKPFEIRDEKTKRVVRGNTYAVRSVDENGEVFECAIKPFRPSDKALLEMLLK